MSVFTLQYARALADVVIADKLEIEPVEQQLGDFLSTFFGSRDLREIFENPSIKLDAKLKVLDAMAPRIGMAKQVRNFLAVLLQNGRIDAIGPICAAYRHEINLRLGVSEAVVTSVRELDGSEKQKIEAEAAALTGVKVHAVYRQDPSLLGGVILRIGDTIYDGSVRGRLEELREKLIAN